MDDPAGAAPVVCVPARDEVERLPRLLRSLAGQDGFSAAARLRVVIAANNCSDGTVERVRRMVADREVAALDLRLIETTLAPAQAHVGTARRLALDAGAEWLEADGCWDGVLLTTDADAWVPRDWVAANLHALGEAEIVGGRLVIHRDADRSPGLAGLHARIERYWQAVRALEERLDPPDHDPAPRHGDHTGASLALRAGLYRAVGGLPPLRRGEDNALVANVQDQGGRLRHCPAVRVHVSDRAEGRAEGGMAVEMVRRQAVLAKEEVYRLPAAGHWHRQILRRADLRRSWPEAGTDAGWTAFAEKWGLSDEDRAAVAPEHCPNAIAFVSRASRRLEARAAPAPLEELKVALAGFEVLLGEDAA